MRKWVFAAFVVALPLGFAFGWVLRGEPKEVVKIVERPVRVAAAPPKPRPQRFPDYPKPPFALPEPEATPSPLVGGAAMPRVIVGDLPRLPTVEGGVPVDPGVPSNVPVADLKADEALARRIVLQSGGDVVSSADAKDASGKIGRALVAETPSVGREPLENALRKALGDRVVLSDGGSVAGTSPEFQKAERDLDAARKQRDKARLDFLPEAPALKQIEDDYARQEKSLDALRKATARLRLNILIRPVLP